MSLTPFEQLVLCIQDAKDALTFDEIPWSAVEQRLERALELAKAKPKPHDVILPSVRLRRAGN